MPSGSRQSHQLAGTDPRERGFNRPVECEHMDSMFRAVLRYERERVTAEHPHSAEQAVRELVHVLHQQGYRQLRSRLSFDQGRYLGSQEPWVEYPDPLPVPVSAGGLMGRLKHWLTGATLARRT